MWARMACVAAIAMATGLPAAHAQTTPLERALTAYANADFPAALALLEEAERSQSLTRDELGVLLEARALALRGLGDRDGSAEALRALASIDPDRRFAAAVPPDVVHVFRMARDALEGPLSVRAEASRSGDDVVVGATVASDPGELVRAVRVRARVDGGPWRAGEGSVALAGAASERVLYHAAAIGPGGAVLATHGQPESPNVLEPESADDAGGEGASAVPWIAAGAVVLAAVVVAIVLVASSGSEDTEVRWNVGP